MKKGYDYQSRRNFLTGTSAYALSAFAIPDIGQVFHHKNENHEVIPKTPEEYVNLYRKVTASLEDGKETITTFGGITYGMTPDMVVRPLHGVNVAMFTGS